MNSNIIKNKIKCTAGFTLVEIIAVLIVLAVLTAIAVPKYIDLSVIAKKKASAAGIAELNSREKLLWSRAKLINDPEILSSDEVMDHHLFYLMNLDLNSGTDNYWDSSVEGWSSAGTAGTLVFEGVESGIWRYPATLDQPGRWMFSENMGTTLFPGFTSSDDFLEIWGKAADDDGWTVSDNILKTNGKGGYMHIKGTEGENYSITLDAKLNSGPGYGVMYRSTKANHYNPNGYSFQFDPGLGNMFVARKFTNGDESVIKKVEMKKIFGDDFDLNAEHNFDLNAEHKISVEVVDNKHTIKVDNQLVLEFLDDSHKSGSVGIRGWNHRDKVSNADFKNVQVVEK